MCGRIDLGRIERRWPDILRFVASIHTGAAPAYDILCVLAPGGTLTRLGDALAHDGRIFRTLHVLSYIDDEPYRREITGMRNLQEGRHDLAGTMFHGRKGELRHGYVAIRGCRRSDAPAASSRVGVRRHARRGDIELLSEVLDNPARNVNRIGDECADEAARGQLHREPSRL